MDRRSPGLWVDVGDPWIADYPEEVPVFSSADSAVLAPLSDVMESYYQFSPSRGGASFCDTDSGEECVVDVLENTASCRGVDCRGREAADEFIRKLTFLSLAYPESPTALGHAIFAAVRLDRVEDVRILVTECPPSWHCDLARGYLDVRTGQEGGAGEEFERALPLMPDTIRCRIEDVSALLPREFRRSYAALPCKGRSDIEAQLWWLSDPLLSDDHNGRRVEHVARTFESLMAEQMSPIMNRSRFSPAIHAERMRRGFKDSWAVMDAGWRSVKGAVNHFVPDRFPWSGLDGPLEYRLEATLEDEGYTRPGPVVRSLPHTFARFIEGDSLVLATISEIPLDSIEDRAGTNVHFVASPEPGTVRILGPTEVSDRASFLATLPEVPHLTGIEVVGPDYVGRSRFAVLPLRSEEPGAVISDLLLFRPYGTDLPETRRRATSRMLGRNEVERGLPLGIYWEAYDVPPGPVAFELFLEGDEGGLFSRLGRAIGLVGDPRESRLEWSEEVAEEVFRRSITVETENLDPGEYDVTLQMTGGDGTILERSTSFRVLERDKGG